MGWIVMLAMLCTAEPPELSLDAAIREAVRVQPLLEVFRQANALSDADYQRERAMQLPAVNFSAQVLEGSNNASSATSLSVQDFAHIAGIASSQGIPTEKHPSYVPRTNVLVGLAAHYRIADFGHTRGRLDAAVAQIDASHAWAQQALQDVIFNVSAAYLQVVAARQALEIAKDTQRRAQEHQQLAVAGVKSGMRPSIDTARSAAELAAADLGVIRAQTAFLVSRSSLNLAIGWSPHPYSVVAPPEPIPTAPLAVADVLAAALAHRPDMVAYKAQQQAAASQVQAAFALHFPQIDATASATVRGVNEAPHAFNWDVALVLTLPVFSGFAIEAENAAAAALLGESRAHLLVLQDRVAHQLEEARDTLVSAAEAVRVATVQVTGATATLNQAEARYREGLGNIVELTDAQAQYDAAQQGLVQSRLAQALSDVQLKYAYAGLQVPLP